MGCTHSRKKKCDFKYGDGKDQTVGEMEREYNEKRDDLDEYSKQNGFESQRNLLVDKTEKLVFRKRSWRYEENKKVHEGYPNFLNPFESKEDETASIEEENDENDAEYMNISEYPVELNPFPTSDDEDSYEDDEMREESKENNSEEPNDTENPTLRSTSENFVEDYNEDENASIEEENDENDTEDKTILEYPVELNPFPASDNVDSYEDDDIREENNEYNLEELNDTTLMNPSENLVENYNKDETTLKEENLENDFSILEENVGINIDNSEDDKNHDIVGALSSAENSKNMITINSLPPLSSKISNALPADIKYKNVMRPAPLPPSLSLLATQNKTTSNRMLDKTTSSEVEKVTERKILRKAPPPPRRFAPLPQSVCLTKQLQSRVKVCDFNNSTISNAEFPQGYRNLRPAPPPPVSYNSNMDKTLQSKTIPDNVYGRKPRRKSILDLFKVKKKKKMKKN